MRIIYILPIYTIALLSVLSSNNEGTSNDVMYGNTFHEAMIAALKGERYSEIELLLDNHAISIDFEKNGPEYFIWSLRCKKNICIKLLLEHGMDADTFDSDENRNMIFDSLGPDRQEHLDALLKFDVDINVADNNGQTPLIYAIVLGQYKTAIKLVKNGADTKLKDRFGDDALAVFDEIIPSVDSYQDELFF